MSLDSRILHILPKRLAAALAQAVAPAGPGAVRSIRLRRDKPLSVDVGGAERLVSESGRLEAAPLRPLCPTGEELEQILSLATQASYYAAEAELRRGYLTLPGGHRLGVAGEAVVEPHGVKTIKHVTSVHIRVAHEVKGCADPVMPHLVDAAGRPVHALIVGPPGSGKTTLLRDVARQLAGRGYQVAVADERSEIAGTYRGAAQLDVGPRTDVLDGAPKALAMQMIVRSLAPDVIVTDEIGAHEDAAAVADVLRCGVTLIASAHAAGLHDAAARPVLRELVQARTFQRMVILSRRGGAGTVERVLDLERHIAARPPAAAPAVAGRWAP